MKFLDCEIGEMHYDRELLERAFFQPIEIDEPLAKITPDKAMAYRLTRAFNTLGYVDPESRISYHKRAAFLKALNAMGIRYHIDYGALGGPRIFIEDKHGQWIDIYSDQKAA